LAAAGCVLALLLSAIAGAVATGTLGGGAGSGSAATVGEQAGLSAYQRQPLAFVANGGRLDRRVRYSARAGGASFFFTASEAVASLTKGERGLALRLRFLDANPEPAIVGARPGKGRVNYLLGDDPTKWQTNLPTYGGIVYRELWPGVAMHVRGREGALKYEFRLRPGADPSRIRLAYHGQRRLALGAGGEMRIETALGSLRDARPVSYQMIVGRRVPVASRFALGNGGAYGFALGAYDPRYPVVIDPGLVYSTYLGGSSLDWGRAIAVDGAGSAYVTGNTQSTNFPTTVGAFDASLNGGGDAFVTKLNAAGSALAYSTYLGGNGVDRGLGIAVDGAGSAYVTGDTNSTDFATTVGAFDTTHNGVEDAFVTKLNAAGSALAYSTYLGGSGGVDQGHGIAVDGAGSAYVTGFSGSANFPTTAGAFDMSANGLEDPFVTKLNAAGSALAYSTYLGGSSRDEGEAIAVDGAGSAYLTGYTRSTNFPTTAGAFDTSIDGFEVAFVTKLNAAGSALAYSTYLGGVGLRGTGYGIAVDGAGSAYVTGVTDSSTFPTTPGAFDTSYNNNYDAVVTKLNAAGSALAYSTYLGGQGTDLGYGIAVDGAGSAYVTGETGGTSPPPRAPSTGATTAAAPTPS